MTKVELAHELGERAKQLAAGLDRDPLELAMIAHKIASDHELLVALGFSSIKEWGERTFGKRWKSIQNLVKVYAKLFVDCGYPKEDILAIGTVKANLLARLPESEIRKEEWLKAAFTLNTSDFKQKVKAFLDESPDHKEGYCKVTFDAPKSFRDDSWKPTIAKGMAAEGTEEPYVVVEAALANYSIELENQDARDYTEAVTGEDAPPASIPEVPEA